ncbi:MAG: hypothetical protein JJT95_13095 [Pararhodobacter sp.]|nr:hypothetical protein [Pararhodobacter sp.]
MTKHTDSSFLAWFDRHFDIRLPFTRFARNVVLLSLAGLAPALGLYVALTPGFAAHLIGADAALARLLRQVLSNGLPVVFVVNALSFILFAQLRRRDGGREIRPAAALVLDLAARTVLFLVLHAAIYAGSAILFDSFGADPMQALRVVGPTLVQAAGFGNLSGVYLYATLVSALPLHMALAEMLLRRRRGSTAHPALPAVLAVLVIAAQFLALTLASMVLARLL